VTSGQDGAAGKYRQERIELALFDLENDPLETRNLIEDRPEVAARLKALAEGHRSRFYPNTE
jgi:hypothetical protein